MGAPHRPLSAEQQWTRRRGYGQTPQYLKPVQSEIAAENAFEERLASTSGKGPPSMMGHGLLASRSSLALPSCCCYGVRPCFRQPNVGLVPSQLPPIRKME